jgi:hypothetical protein
MMRAKLFRTVSQANVSIGSGISTSLVGSGQRPHLAGRNRIETGSEITSGPGPEINFWSLVGLLPTYSTTYFFPCLSYFLPPSIVLLPVSPLIARHWRSLYMLDSCLGRPGPPERRRSSLSLSSATHTGMQHWTGRKERYTPHGPQAWVPVLIAL